MCRVIQGIFFACYVADGIRPQPNPCMWGPFIVVHTVRAHQAARGPALFWPVASPARHGNTRAVPSPTRPSGRAWVDEAARRVSPGTARINGRPVQPVTFTTHGHGRLLSSLFLSLHSPLSLSCVPFLSRLGDSRLGESRCRLHRLRSTDSGDR